MFSNRSKVFLAISAAFFVFSCHSKAPDLPLSADTGFKVASDAFAFENFADDYDASKMNASLAARMFGADNVCEPGSNPCIATSAAQAWIDSTNDSMAGGHCEGIAVLAQMFFRNHLKVSDFGAAKAKDLVIDDNYPLQREVAFWYATQLVPDAFKNNPLMPRDAIKFMNDFMQPGSTEFYRIGIVQRTATGFGEGHSLTPIGFYRTANADIYNVRVYDNNFADQEKILELDVNANTWKYTGSTGGSAVSFEGGESAKNPLYFAPAISRDAKLPCPFCKDSPYRTVVATGGSPLVTSPAGETGIKDGQIVATEGSIVSPGFSDCKGSGATVSVSSKTSATDPVTVSLAPNGAATQNVTIQGGSMGSVVVQGDLTSGNTAAQIQASADSVAVQSHGGQANVSFKVGTTTVTVAVTGATGNLTISRDPTTGKLSINTADSQNATVKVTLTEPEVQDARSPDKYHPSTSFTYNANSGNSTATVALSPTGWGGGDIPAVTATTADGGTVMLPGSTCHNNKQDGDESDVDCGGSCDQCGPHYVNKPPFKCNSRADCSEGGCLPKTAAVNPGTCIGQYQDTVKDGDETDVDCGGGGQYAKYLTRCSVGQKCINDGDCGSGYCSSKKTCGGSYWIWGYADAPVSGLGVKIENDPPDTSASAPKTVYTGWQDWAGQNRTSILFTDVRLHDGFKATIVQQPPDYFCTVTHPTFALPTGDVFSQVNYNLVTCTKSIDICSDKVKDGVETDVDCGGTNCVGAGRFCTIGQTCGTDADCGAPINHALCVSNVCTPTYDIGGTVSTTVPIQLSLTPGGTLKQSSAGSPLVITAKPSDTQVLFANTRVLNSYNIDYQSLAGVTCSAQNTSGVATANVTNYSLTCTSCANGTREGKETDVDCGGADCRAENKFCGNAKNCAIDADCVSGLLCNQAKHCAIPVSCSNGVQDGNETDVDCGGLVCDYRDHKLCGDGKMCQVSADCLSGTCNLSSHTCALTVACTNGVKDGMETDVDCGGTTCVSQSKLCADGKTCSVDTDCSSASCNSATKTCVSCSNGVKDGAETDVDCGGASCDGKSKTCADNKGCAADGDCTSGACNLGTKLCFTPQCSNSVKDGTETDVDCGGTACGAKGKACAVGKSCLVGSDCGSGVCDATHKCIGAMTWSTVSSTTFGPTGTSHDNAYAISANEIWASGGELLGTYDGTNWTTQTPMPGFPIKGMLALSNLGQTQVWVTATGNVMKFWNGSQWFTPNISFTPGSTLSSIHGVSNQIFVVGTSGQVAKYNVSTGDFASEFAGGFPPMPPPTMANLNSVFVLDQNNTWAVGDGGAIIYNNGGFWTLQTSNTTANLRSVWVASATSAFAVGDSGAVVQWNGTAWSLVTSFTTQNLYAVWGESASSVWAVGAAGTIFYWNGSTWTSEMSGVTADLKTVFGVGGVRYSMGANNTFIKRN